MRTHRFSLGLAAAAILAVAWAVGGGSASADAAGRTIDIAWNGDAGGTPVSDDEAAQLVGGTCSYWKNYYCSCTVFCSGCNDVYAWTPCTFFCSLYYDYYGVLDGPYSCGGTCGGYWTRPYRCGTGITSTTVVGG